MPDVSLLIKPASSLCDMRCRYCFYDDVSSLRTAKNYGVMDRETSAQLIRSAFNAAGKTGHISFAFQGGEPTAAGIGYFREFLELESQYARPGVAVDHAIQTNGLSLDKEWVELFRTHRFLVGLSLDGTKDLHDLHRLDAKGKGTWNRVTRTVGLLQRTGVEFNFLCVVTGQCARHPQKVYQSLKKLGGQYLQFIPCLDPMEEVRGTAPYSLSPDAYGKFLCGLFDVWYADWRSGQYVSVRLFDDYVHLMMGQPSGSCSTSRGCGHYLVAEGDGSLYPCDFYVLDCWRLGTLDDCSITQVAESGTAQEFRAKGNCLPDKCADCRWLALCNGGCQRDWVAQDGKVENYYCSAFRTFFDYATPRLTEIARAELMNCSF